MNQPSNLVLVCGSGTTGCHGRIEQNRAWAEDLGLLVRRGRVAPAEVPVRLFGVGLVLLDDEGGYRAAGSPEG